MIWFDDYIKWNLFLNKEIEVSNGILLPHNKYFQKKKNSGLILQQKEYVV